MNRVKAILITIALYFLSVSPVFAQTLICRNPGPYAICVPDTDIVIGDIVITDEALVLIGVLFITGIVMVVSSLKLRELLSR